MEEILIRPAERGDLERMTEIYNYYVINTPITFDLTPVSVASRVPWFDAHSDGARYRLFVAQQAGSVLGFAGTGRFRDRAAYDTTVEATIYCAHEATGRGLGSQLYCALFEAIQNEDIHRIMAGITMPNDASIALHERFGFKEVAMFSENGRKFDRYWDVCWMERPLRI